MKICIATGPWLPVPPIEGGSTARVWKGLAEEFSQAGHETTIFCRAHPTQPETESLGGVDYVRFSGMEQSKSIWISLLKDFFYALRATPRVPTADIYVFHDFWLPALFPLLRGRRGTVMVVGRFPKRQFWLYPRISSFVGLSRAVHLTLIEQTPSTADRSTFIGMPVNGDIFHSRNSPPPSKREASILFVGRIHPEKGLELLLEAFQLVVAHHPDARLEIIGPADPSLGGGGEVYLQNLKNRGAELPIEWHPPEFDTRALAEHYRRARVFCYPSLAEHGETFGLAPLEAMACGLVTVVSSLECFEDFLRPGHNGCSFNHREHPPAKLLATQLISALEPTQKNDRIAEQAASDAATFSYSSIAQEYLNLFEELL